MTRIFSVLGMVAFAVLISGCGDGISTTPVRGKVTLEGGPWPAEGTIQFSPVEAAEGSPIRPGTGTFKSDGAFTVTSFAEGDGLVPGKYQVGVQCWESHPSMAPDGTLNPGKNAVPEKFQSNAWTLEVPAGSSSPINVTYDVKKN